MLVLLLPSFEQAGSGLDSPSEARVFFWARIGVLCSRVVCLEFCRGEDPEEEEEEDDAEAPRPVFVFSHPLGRLSAVNMIFFVVRESSLLCANLRWRSRSPNGLATLLAFMVYVASTVLVGCESWVGFVKRY